MSVVDLIKDNAIAATLAAAIAGGGVVYVVAPIGTSGKFPDHFDVHSNGQKVASCDFTATTEAICNMNNGMAIQRHPGDMSKVKIMTGMWGGPPMTGLTWSQMLAGVDVTKHDFNGKSYGFKISVKPL